MGKLDIKEAKKAQVDAASRDYIVQPRLGECTLPRYTGCLLLLIVAAEQSDRLWQCCGAATLQS